MLLYIHEINVVHNLSMTNLVVMVLLGKSAISPTAMAVPISLSLCVCFPFVHTGHILGKMKM